MNRLQFRRVDFNTGKTDCHLDHRITEHLQRYHMANFVKEYSSKKRCKKTNWYHHK